MGQFPPSIGWKNQYTLGLIILVGLIHGLLYIFLIPPWQHYDEPSHFEYAWWLANHGELPQQDDFDQAMRRELAASMIEHGFFEATSFRPNLLSITKPIWIGLSQFDDPPIYYGLVSLPLYLIRGTDITFQLYIGRFISLSLYLLTLLAAFGVVTELTEPGNPLRWLVPLTIALLPGFTDIMTAVNNDVGAVAFFSLYLWVSLRLIRRGFTWLRLLGLFISALLCVFTKSTVFIALPLLVYPLGMLFLSNRQRRYGLAALILLGVGAGIVLLRWNGVSDWFLPAENGVIERVILPDTPSGDYAIKLMPSSDDRGYFQASQLLPIETARKYAGKDLTLGAWIWSDQSGTADTPRLIEGNQSQSDQVEVSETPTFYPILVRLNEDANQVLITLSPPLGQEGSAAPIYYDNLVLVEGDYTQAGVPSIVDQNAQTIKWGNDIHENLVHNASFEDGWVSLWGRVDDILDNFLPFTPNLILASLSDLNTAGWYYRITADNLLRTFWGKFGWGQVELIGSKPYRILAVITLIALISASVLIWNKRKVISWEIAGYLGIISILLWGMAWLRGINSLVSRDFIPSARYAFPVIIPTVLVLCLGWWSLMRWVGRKLHSPTILLLLVYLVPFLVLDILSILSIMGYYA